MPAMNLQIVWSIHVCIKLVWYCLEWKTLQLCGWMLPISCLRSLKRKSSLQSASPKHIVYCTLAHKKCTIQKEKAVARLPTLLRKLKWCFKKFFSMKRTLSVWNFSHPVNFYPIWSPDVHLSSKQLDTFAGEKHLTKKTHSVRHMTCYDLGRVVLLEGKQNILNTVQEHWIKK